MLELEGIAQPIVLTLTLATVVTAILAGRRNADRLVAGAVAGMPGARRLAPLSRCRSCCRRRCSASICCIAFGPNGPGGSIASLWGARTLAFSFEGLVIGSVIYSLPFIVQPLRNAFEAIGDDTARGRCIARCAAVADASARVEVPLARPGYLTGAVLAFAHTVGEFGVVLMIGGNSPGETNVLSVAIFNYVERGLWNEAHILSLGMVLFAFVAISATMLIDRRLSRIA